MLTLITLCCIGCGEGGLKLITQESIEDVVSCYESVETDGDSYFIALDKNCVDMELSDFGGPAVAPVDVEENAPRVNLVPTEFIGPEPDHQWELIATLQRDPLRPDRFYVPSGKVAHLPDLTDTLTGAFAAGKDFIFVIKKGMLFPEKQFYIQQVGPPVFKKPSGRPLKYLFKPFVWHFPSQPTWYRFTGTHHLVQQDLTYMGLTVEFDLIRDPNKKRKYWVTPAFGLSLDGRQGVGGTFRIHEGRELAIYVSKSKKT